METDAQAPRKDSVEALSAPPSQPSISPYDTPASSRPVSPPAKAPLQLTDAASAVVRANMRVEPRLITAVRTADESMLEMILDSSADLDATDETGATALMFAASAANTRALGMLLAGGADVTFADAAGDTALVRAVRTGNLEVVRLLLHHAREAVPGFSLDDEPGRRCLGEAARLGYSALVMPLVRANADVGHEDVAGKTPLLHAVASEHASTVRELIDAKADVQYVASDGSTALALGFALRSDLVVRELLASVYSDEPLTMLIECIGASPDELTLERSIALLAQTRYAVHSLRGATGGDFLEDEKDPILLLLNKRMLRPWHRVDLVLPGEGAAVKACLDDTDKEVAWINSCSSREWSWAVELEEEWMPLEWWWLLHYWIFTLDAQLDRNAEISSNANRSPEDHLKYRHGDDAAPSGTAWYASPCTLTGTAGHRGAARVAALLELENARKHLASTRRDVSRSQEIASAASEFLEANRRKRRETALLEGDAKAKAKAYRSSVNRSSEAMRQSKKAEATYRALFMGHVDACVSEWIDKLGPIKTPSFKKCASEPSRLKTRSWGTLARMVRLSLLHPIELKSWALSSLWSVANNPRWLSVDTFRDVHGLEDRELPIRIVYHCRGCFQQSQILRSLTTCIRMRHKLEVTDSQGRTAVHLLCSPPQVGLLTRLVPHGSVKVLNAVDTQGLSAASLLLRGGEQSMQSSLDCMALLMKAGASLRCVATPQTEEDDKESFQDKIVVSNPCETLLHVAVEQNQPEHLEQLLKILAQREASLRSDTVRDYVATPPAASSAAATPGNGGHFCAKAHHCSPPPVLSSRAKSAPDVTSTGDDRPMLLAGMLSSSAKRGGAGAISASPSRENVGAIEAADATLPAAASFKKKSAISFCSEATVIVSKESSPSVLDADAAPRLRKNMSTPLVAEKNATDIARIRSANGLSLTRTPNIHSDSEDSDAEKSAPASFTQSTSFARNSRLYSRRNSAALVAPGGLLDFVNLVDAERPNGMTALTLGISLGRHACVELLLKFKASLTRDGSGCTPLHYAIQQNDPLLVTRILQAAPLSQRRSLLTATDSESTSALMAAAGSSSSRALEAIMLATPHLWGNDEELPLLEQMLEQALMQSSADCVVLLTKRCVPLQRRFIDIVRACVALDRRELLMLIAERAQVDPELRDERGDTFLHALVRLEGAMGREMDEDMGIEPPRSITLLVPLLLDSICRSQPLMSLFATNSEGFTALCIADRKSQCAAVVFSALYRSLEHHVVNIVLHKREERQLLPDAYALSLELEKSFAGLRTQILPISSMNDGEEGCPGSFEVILEAPEWMRSRVLHSKLDSGVLPVAADVTITLMQQIFGHGVSKAELSQLKAWCTAGLKAAAKCDRRGQKGAGQARSAIRRN